MQFKRCLACGGSGMFMTLIGPVPDIKSQPSSLSQGRVEELRTFGVGEVGVLVSLMLVKRLGDDFYSLAGARSALKIETQHKRRPLCLFVY